MRRLLAPLLRLYHRPVLLGRENMPRKGPCFIIANHSGLYDPFFINYHLRETPLAGIMTDEYLRAGIGAWFFRKLGVVATRKFQPQATPVRQLLRLVRDERMIVLMPEGESNWDGVTLPTVASTGKLFRTAGVPVHPVILHNGYQAFPRWATWPRPARVAVEFRPALEFTPEMSDGEVARLVDEAVQWHPDREPPELRWQGRWAFRPATGITRLIFRCPHCAVASGLREQRGRYLHCRRCRSRWQVTADAALVHLQSGDRQSTTAAFQAICRMPREAIDFGQQGLALIRTPAIKVFRETEYPGYRYLGRYDCLLRNDRIDLIPVARGETITLPLESLRSFSAELKVKLQLRTGTDLYQLRFDRGSSLQWQVYLKGLLPRLETGLVRPTDYAHGHGLNREGAAA